MTLKTDVDIPGLGGAGWRRGGQGEQHACDGAGAHWERWGVKEVMACTHCGGPLGGNTERNLHAWRRKLYGLCCMCGYYVK